MGFGEGGANLLELSVRLRRTEVNGGADAHGTEVGGLTDRREENLVVGRRVVQEVIVIDLHNEGNLVNVLARHGAEDAEGRRNGAAVTGNCEIAELGRVKVGRVLRETGRARVLDTLVDREDGEVSGAPEAAVVVQRAETAQHRWAAVGVGKHVINEVGTRGRQQFLRERRGDVVQQRGGFFTEERRNIHGSRLPSALRGQREWPVTQESSKSWNFGQTTTMTFDYLRSLQRRMRAMHSLYEDACATMTLEHVNHFERAGVLPIAFSLIHQLLIEDTTLPFAGGPAQLFNDEWATKMGLAIPDHGKHMTVDEMVHQRIGNYEAFLELQALVFAKTEGFLKDVDPASLGDIVVPAPYGPGVASTFSARVGGDLGISRSDAIECWIYQHGLRHMGEIELARALVGLGGMTS